MQLGKSKLFSVLGEQSSVDEEGEEGEREEMRGERGKRGPCLGKLYIQC